jgi:hypothetical protein
MSCEHHQVCIYSVFILRIWSASILAREGWGESILQSDYTIIRGYVAGRYYLFWSDNSVVDCSPTTVKLTKSGCTPYAILSLQFLAHCGELESVIPPCDAMP